MSRTSVLVSLIAALGLALGLSGSAFASTSGQVSVDVVAGPMIYTISDLELEPVFYSDEQGATFGTIQIQVNGNGNVSGWQMTVEATEDFAYEGTAEDARAIPASNLSLTQAQAPLHTAGQIIDTTYGPVATSSSGSLGTALPVVISAAGYGSGSYTQNLDVSLVIPAHTKVGTYTGAVTVSASSAPGIT